MSTITQFLQYHVPTINADRLENGCWPVDLANKKRKSCFGEYHDANKSTKDRLQSWFLHRSITPIALSGNIVALAASSVGLVVSAVFTIIVAIPYRIARDKILHTGLLESTETIIGSTSQIFENLGEFFMQTPLPEIDLDIERYKDYSREVEL